MADVRNNVIVATERSRGDPNVNNMMRRFQQQAPNSTQLLGLVAVVVAGSVFLVLAGLALTVSVLAFVFFMPLILLSSPIWLPLATFFFICAAAFLSVCGFGVAAVAAAAWLYRYIKGLNPPGALRVDYARSRIYDTASHVKDYAKEYGGYLQGKVKDAAPGA